MFCALKKQQHVATMELFVYNWFYTGYTIYGHCLNEGGKYQLVKVKDFCPSCYVEGEDAPRFARAEYRRMLSSRDISTLRPFYRVYFSNAKEMEEFAFNSKRCYMTDIPQVTAFLSQIGADHVGWIRVLKLETDMADIESIPDKIPIASPRVMAFDIEVKSMDSGMPQPHRITDTVEMISVVLFGNSEPVKTYVMHTMKKPLDVDDTIDAMFEDEIKLITGFFDLVTRENPTVITGFNIYGFDIHYMVSRLKRKLIEIPDASRGIRDSISLIKVDWTSDAYGHNSYDRLVIGGRVILDMYLYFKRMKLDKYSLDFVSGKFLGEGKNDMLYAKMAGAFESKDHKILREVAGYCVQDSVLVMRLFEKVQMWIDVCEISKITRCGMEDIYTRGEQMKMISQCVAECSKRNIVLQPQYSSEWKQYEGAYVLEPKKGVYNGCSILDFQSLYPSIIIAYNICPSTYTSLKINSHSIETTNHRFRKSPVGLLPGMIKRILEERKAVKAQMVHIDKDSVEYVVLDRRQNALKICANSVYGMMGFKNSRYFGHLGCAESVTTVGRLLLSNIVDRIDRAYPVQVVYGDSVTGYTPTIVRIKQEFIYIETLENIANRWAAPLRPGAPKGVWVKSLGKEFCELSNVEVWTDNGWTQCYRVIRHALAPHKKILRVLTHTGIVDVTDEHSLLDKDGTPVNANEVEVGNMLLHHPYPQLEETHAGISPAEARMMGTLCGNGSCGTYDCPSGTKTWAINNSNGLPERYRLLMYNKIVPQEILNSSPEARLAFWKGLYDADGDKSEDLVVGGQLRFARARLQRGTIDQKHQVTIASFAVLASSLGFNISLNTREDKPHIFRLAFTKAQQRRNSCAVKKVSEIQYSGYVYDLTTANHHFQAGVGKIIVHNTDSCMLWHEDGNSKNTNLELAMSICDDVTTSLPEPMALKFETYCDKVILLTKKRYVLVSGDKISYKGVMNARRDYCKFAKDTYSEAIGMIAKGATIESVSEYIDKRIIVLLSGKAAVADLIVTKSIARKLSTYKVNQPHVVLAKRLVAKTGLDIPAGTRLEYVFVNDENVPMVTPEEFSEGGYNINGMFYVKKQLATQIDDVMSAAGMGNYIKDSWIS